ARAGRQLGTLCDAIHRRDGERGVRRILGVLALVKKYGAAVVEAACAAALDLGVADYRFVRRYLERHAPAPLTLRQVDPLIRELTHYRDVIARKAQEVTPCTSSNCNAPCASSAAPASPPASRPACSQPRPRSWPPPMSSRASS